MANTLKFKRGLLSGLPAAAEGEPLFTTDTKDLYIGTSTGNQRFQKYIASGTTSQILRGDGSLYTFPLNISSPSNGQVLKYNGTSWVNDSDAGITGSGTTNYLPKFTSGSTLGNSRIFDNGTNVGIGLITPDVELAVYSASVSRFHLQNLSSGVSATDGLQFAISGLDGYIWNWENGGLFFATNNTQRTRITNGGNFIINNASTDNGLRFQVTGDGYFSGSVGIGTTAITGVNLYVLKPLTGSTQAVNVFSRGTIQSDVTQVASYFRTFAGTQAAAFTLSILRHFSAEQTAIGAGSAVGDQMGYYVDSTLIGATNNYGFYGNIASGTGRWNLYMNGTAQNYVNGNFGVGITTPTARVEAVGVSGTTLIRATGADSNGNADVEIRSTGTTGASRLFFGDTAATSGSIIYNHSNDSMQLATASTIRATLDASGNLGLGVTPSAWSLASLSAMQIQNGGFYGYSVNEVGVTSNSYYNSGWKYINSSFATQYSTFNGAHRWYNAPSGTAGNAITFTQAMTLDASGNLAIGNNAATSKVYIAGTSASASATVQIVGNGVSTLLLGQNADGGVIRGQGGNNALTFWTGGVGDTGASSSGTERMRLDASGNLGLGVVPSAWYLGNGVEIGQYTQIHNNFSAGSASFISNAYYLNPGTWYYKATWGASRYTQVNGVHQWFTAASGTAGGIITWSQPMTLFATGNLAVGTTTDAGYKLDVNGTMRVSGASTFGGKLLLSTTLNYGLEVYNNTSADSRLNLTNSTTGTGADKGTMVGAIGTTAYLYNYQNGNLILGTNGTDRLTISNTGAATFSSTVTGASFIPSSSTIPTNGMYLSAANTLAFATASGNKLTISSTGLATFSDSARFSNQKGCIFVQTGGSLLGSISMDSSNQVTIDNNGFFGLSVGSNYTMTGGNLGIGHAQFGTSATRTISVVNGTAPSTSPTDSFQMYSNDVVAGNAAPHFRTENGAVIKLYQETTGVGNAIFSQGGGNSVLDDSTFDGYTLRQIVKALRNQGILQ